MEASSREKKEEFEMLEAMYDFTATIPQTLSFDRDDVFIFHSGNNIQKNWWSVINVKGKVGYIPSNYVSKIKVTKEKLVDFLNHSLEQLGRDIAREGGGTDKQLELIQELITKRQELVEKRHRSKSHSKEKITSSKSLPNSSIEGDKKGPAPSPPLRHTLSESKVAPEVHGGRGEVMSSQNQAESKVNFANARVGSHATYHLIQQVRSQTGLNFEASRLAVAVVTEGLMDMVGGSAASSLEALLELLQCDAPPPAAILDDTPDARALRKLLAHLTACRDDAQQRSWQLWDDETTIKQHINQLSSILSNADPAISKRVLRSSDFADISMLVEYYQMEERWSIRELLLQAFAVMCSLEKTVISILLNSVLPMELAREMQSNSKSLTRLSKSALLLTVIFSTGEPMPITHLEQLGVDFVKMMLELIEAERESEIADTLLMLLLSYNLQFKPQSVTNILVESLSEQECAKTFTEKVLLLINREDDPLVKLRTHQNTYHSVLKLLKDLFSCDMTAKLFYMNDVKVLIDIIVRQITDLPPKSERRTEYLELCRLVLVSCDPAAFEHRLPELRSRLVYMLTDEMPAVPVDRALAREIMRHQPEHFGEYPLENDTEP